MILSIKMILLKFQKCVLFVIASGRYYVQQKKREPVDRFSIRLWPRGQRQCMMPFNSVNQLPKTTRHIPSSESLFSPKKYNRMSFYLMVFCLHARNLLSPMLCSRVFPFIMCVCVCVHRSVLYRLIVTHTYTYGMCSVQFLLQLFDIVV